MFSLQLRGQLREAMKHEASRLDLVEDETPAKKGKTKIIYGI